MLRHQRGRKYWPLPMSGDVKGINSCNFMIYHDMSSCGCTDFPTERIRIPYDSLTPDHHRLKPRKCNMTGEDPRSHGLLSSWGLWYFLVAGHKKYATYCNIKCLGIKEAGPAGHCQCGEMSKELISYDFICFYDISSCYIYLVISCRWS